VNYLALLGALMHWKCRHRIAARYTFDSPTALRHSNSARSCTGSDATEPAPVSVPPREMRPSKRTRQIFDTAEAGPNPGRRTATCGGLLLPRPRAGWGRQCCPIYARRSTVRWATPRRRARLSGRLWAIGIIAAVGASD